MKTLFVAVACLCLLAVVAGRSRFSIQSLIQSVTRESSAEPKILAQYDEEPIQLSQEDQKKCEYKLLSIFICNEDLPLNSKIHVVINIIMVISVGFERILDMFKESFEIKPLSVSCKCIITFWSVGELLLLYAIRMALATGHNTRRWSRQTRLTDGVSSSTLNIAAY